MPKSRRIAAGKLKSRQSALETQERDLPDGIEAGILQFVGFQFCNQADAAALLILVDHEPTPFVGDDLHGHFELVVAITTQRPEHLSGKAL